MQYQLGCLELSNGEFKNGWTRHNLFYTLPVQLNSLVFPDFPVWNGERVTGRPFLLVGEQGRGDEIQFIRFAQWLHQRGAVVDVLVSQPVTRIAASMMSVRSVFTALPPGPYDYWSHMLRMPLYLKLDLPMLPIAMPYLAAERDRVHFWQARIDIISPEVTRKKTRRIGVVWAWGTQSCPRPFQVNPSRCADAPVCLAKHDLVFAAKGRQRARQRSPRA
jgi:hypothetical protein